MSDSDLLVTVGTLVRLLSSVDLPVSVETAGVGQHLPAVLALHARLPVGSDLTGPERNNIRVLAVSQQYLYLLNAAQGSSVLLDLVSERSVGRGPSSPGSQTVQPGVALTRQAGQEVTLQLGRDIQA